MAKYLIRLTDLDPDIYWWQPVTLSTKYHLEFGKLLLAIIQFISIE